ncbi:MAG: c-type cytochrome domain-containing protein, partial [Pirellulaceae bacterium]
MISWLGVIVIAVAYLPGQPPAQQTEAAEAGQAPAPAVSSPSVAPISFRESIAPILQESCVSCHGARKAEGGYRIDTLGKLEIAGDGGTAPIDRKEWTKSEIYQRIISEDSSTRMPAEREPLTKEQIEVIAKWLAQG